jgi:crotonobetainyl-CoA:carnitine CoA-transferase CaiB-like acyl-CoA transferase
MQPLAGFTILDLTRLLPGGFSTMALADLGARVIKVEEPTRGDYLRGFAPMGARDSVLFSALNRGMESLTLDLMRAEGRAVLLELARTADVLIEGNRPGVMARLGLGDEALRAENARLVICHLSGYGQSGPRSALAGHDLNYVATAGALPLLVPRGSSLPIVPGVQIADLAGGALTSALGIVAALLERERTGRATTLDIGMTQGVLHLLHTQAAELLATGASPEWARGLLSGGYACYAVYATADGGSITVACVEPQFWARFCERIGRADLAGRQFDVDQQPLFDACTAIVATRTRDEWTTFFGGDDVCVAPVLSLREALTAHADRLVETDAGEGERVRAPGGLFGETAPGASPALGEHSMTILEALGRSRDEIAALHERGVT